ncbi:hypothetical protein PCASD_04870 [Puccinia coronata f. sp. avenae]|uniref:Uncharacterized protein n=1 Tax=Puccinia coronata f. sp. avenae TaxID=200324 RepID=A0A2N5V265_9BASI|nr:hypothetical protein PCASD_04870 [Puccinia coronata f. sp. avenae]
MSESKDEGDPDGLATCHYEMEMDEINDANEMVQFMEDATNNIISNEDDSSGTEDEIFECLLPLFLDGINQDPQDGIDPSNENIDPILLDSSVQAQAASEIEARLNNRFNQYLSSPKSKSKPTLATKAKGQFKELNNAIISVTSLYTKKAKKGSLFKIPTDVLANLHKFNLLWRDYALEGFKSPSNSAAISTAKSAIWRSPTS